ncbi:zinc finger, C3HC4 type, domain containing protein [Musa troglodytarum]|nr:zinc finger, C3HC4 type, domain containing protein [Musa troglodytarum]
MAGDSMARIDRLIASEACFDSANDGVEASFGCSDRVARPLVDGGAVLAGCREDKKPNQEVGSGAVVECRICQEEGEERHMEAPCACKGTLKFAHRTCIQRWCNKKQNITCEICNQIFGPNYIVPPSRPNSDVMAIDVSWGTLIDYRDSHLIGIAAAEQDFLSAEHEDYVASSANGIACCHVIALTLTLLLLLRHILIVIRNIEMVQDMSAVYNVTIEFAAFFLPCYVMARSCYIITNRWRQQI